MAPIDLAEHGGLERYAGQRQWYLKNAKRGRYLRSQPLRGERLKFPLDIAATVQAATLRTGGRAALPLTLHQDDLRQKIHRQQRKGLVVFAVDASDSMGEGTVARMRAAKGAILGLLKSAYQRRDQVALVVFRGDRAEVLLPPSTSILLARQCLRQLYIGGATPFADGLVKARQVIQSATQKDPGLEALLVILSDGEANVPLVSGHDVNKEIDILAVDIRKEKLKTVLIDSGTGHSANTFLAQLSFKLGAEYFQIRDLHAGRLLEILRG